MAVNLYLTNWFSITAVDGTEVTGQQGAAGDDPRTPLTVSVDGTVVRLAGQIATATASSLFASSQLSTWDYLHFRADQTVYVQVIGSTGNFVVRVTAETPFTLSRHTLKAAATTTPITGGTEPTLESVASVVVGNYSGATANFALTVVS